MPRIRPRASAAALLLLALAQLPSAHCGTTATSTRDLAPAAPLEVALYDRTTGRLLPLHEHRGELYVAGAPGHEYELRLCNPGDARVMAVTSVDGINVITGRTAALDQPGYVLDAGASAQIDGWRKSLGEVASFEFTTPRRSYAARTGRPDDVGVIGIAMFRERRAYTRLAPSSAGDAGAGDRARADAGAEAAADKAIARSAARASAESTQAAAPALGTGHGSRRDSPVTRTDFERASARPDAVIRIYYDSERQLVARGVLEPPARVAQRRPEPFPGGFVPDP